MFQMFQIHQPWPWFTSWIMMFHSCGLSPNPWPERETASLRLGLMGLTWNRWNCEKWAVKRWESANLGRHVQISCKEKLSKPHPKILWCSPFQMSHSKCKNSAVPSQQNTSWLIVDSFPYCVLSFITGELGSISPYSNQATRIFWMAQMLFRVHLNWKPDGISNVWLHVAVTCCCITL